MICDSLAKGISLWRYLAKGFTMGSHSWRYLQGTTCCIHEDTKLRRKEERESGALSFIIYVLASYTMQLVACR
jgi:hypothetical protein